MRFILVDRIVELDPGVSVVAEKWVDPAEDYFRDHFPGFPVVPGVLLIEMMAQAAGKCLDAERHPRGKAMLASLRSARFKQWVGPGETVTIRGTIRTNRDSFAVADCAVSVAGKGVASAEILFCFVPGDRFAPDYVDTVLEEYLAGKGS